MRTLRRHSQILRTVIPIIISISLVLGSGVGIVSAVLLSGAETTTLVREPQQTPEGLGAAGFDGLQFADPAAQIDLIQPPVANNQGDAQVVHPLSVPPGRAGIQPKLALAYSSAGGNGWVGQGWELSVGEVTVDTRWGVPRYDTDDESETYLLDGEQLAPTAVRSALLPREADRVFTRRIEGEFERIVRHGAGPGSYWWEVTDKSGAHRFYGGTPEGGRDAGAILADDNGNGFTWALTQIRDISNNTATFTYDAVTGAGVGKNSEHLGRELYLTAIKYTGTVAAGLTDDPAYEVKFLRDSDLSESLRPDISIDATGGFLRVTSELLRQVEVRHRGELVQRYELKYAVGAFDKTLLQSVDQAGADGITFATHTFDYFDDVRKGATYDGFAASEDWDTKDDNVTAGLDLGASALGGAELIGGGGRAYIGYNQFKAGKGGSFGGGFVGGADEGKSRLELLDINGDNLPDKVFEESGAVKYRLNTSGPDGGTTFGDKHTVANLDNLSREKSDFFSVGAEAYAAVSLMYNHAWSKAWGREYFIDVNTDGLVDFVQNGKVYFNILNSDGNPEFIENSSGTALEIDSGTFDSSLVPDTSAVEAAQREQAPLQDTLRRWRAPWDGTVTIEGNVQLLPPAGTDPVVGDGVRVAIQHNGSELWSTNIAGDDYTAHTPTFAGPDIVVNSGDKLYFRVQSVDDGASDEVSWDPLITYSNTTSLDANGLDIYRYQASEDFTLAGRSDIVTTVPMTGTLRVTGSLSKTRKTTDDITIQVLKNGTLVGSSTIARSQTGDIPFMTDFSVIGGDDVLLRLKIDSPVDLSAFSWTSSLSYLSATQDGQPVTVIDGNGAPISMLNPPADIQIYPGNDLVAPQATWTAPATANVTVKPAIAFDLCAPSSPTLDCSNDGTVVVTVKKKITPSAGDPPSVRVATHTIHVTDGVDASELDFPLAIEENAEYWFDLSVAQPALGMDWQSGSISIQFTPDQIISVPSARHWAFIPDDVFPMPHRGWGIAGYNGDGDLATAPIVESNLFFDEGDYPTSDPEVHGGDPDYPTYADVDPDYNNPIHGKSYAYAPYVAIDETTSIVTRQWRGSKANLFGSATGVGSSRVGPDSIGYPDVSVSSDTRAVSRFSMTEGDAIAVSFAGVVGGSYAWGASEGRLDYFDMNGDQFPDIIGNGGVQYTTARGGLETTKTSLSEFSDNMRKDRTTSYTVDLGGTPAKISADSKGEGNTPQDAATSSGKEERSSSSNGDTGAAESGDEGQSVELGLSGSLGGSSTNKEADSPTSNLIERELADINGDGLPDLIRVYKDPSVHMTVSFNLGYRFDSNEIDWPGDRFEEGDSVSYGVGASLGFTTGKREFSGGSSVNISTEKSLSTWVDMNGDGLLDQLVRVNDSTIEVRFGTGAGLTSPVDWGDFEDDNIARSQSRSLGVGFDFTISIGPLCLAGCYIIVNPGGDGEIGMSRQELELNDVNGDGYPDHIASTSDELMKVALNTTGRTNLLKSVSNPLGGGIALDYTREGNTTSQAFSQWVMSSVAVDDGRAGDGPDVRLTTYEYADNVYDPVERDFLGYATVIEHQHDTAATDNPVLRSFERVYRNGNIFDTGLLKRVTSLDADDNAIEETVKEWGFVKTGTTDPADLSVGGVALLEMSVFPVQVKSEYSRYSNGSVIKNTYSTFVYDVLGNVISSTDVGEPTLPGDDVVAIFTYTACIANSWVSIPQTFTVQDGSGAVLRHRWAENGGNEMCDNGVITTLYEDTGSGIAQTDLDFDSWGNYNQIIYPANENGERYQVNYVYDPDRRTSIAEVTDSFGLVGRATYHDPTGQIASRTDPNGQTTSYTYDPQGRPASITGPYEQGTGNATVTFEYFPTAPDYAYGLAHNYDAFNPSGTIDTVSFLDGIGRETQTKQDATLFRGAGSTAQDVMVVSGAVEFDALGRAVREWHPIEEPLGTIGVYNLNTDDVAPTLFAYDLEDRITQVERPSGATTTTAYGYDDASRFNTTMYLTTRTDSLGNARRAYTDVRDNVLAVKVDHEPGPTVFTEQVFLPLVSGGSIDAAAPPATAQPETVAAVTLRTSFIYDPLQQLVQTIDPAGNETHHEYDLLGRRTATTTPDGGRVEMVYDLASQVITKITPNLRSAGGEISYEYDYNRLVGISYTDGTPNVIYTYGDTTATNNGIGRIVRVEDGARIQLRSFGLLGEVVEDTTTMLVHNLDERFTWTTASTFDSWGRPKTVTYPDGEVVTHDYDSGGFMSSMAGLKGGVAYPYVNRLEYDKFSSRRFTETGNSVATETQYDQFNRRLSRRIVDAPGRRVQDITYEYDSIGNVLNADNAAPSPQPDLMGGTSQQVFDYDDLYRLISATGSYDFAPGKWRDYTYDVAYDTVGNIVGKSQTDTVFENPEEGIPQFKTTYNQRYDYTAAPHQPTHIGHRSYTYDANGNLTGWTDDDSGENRTVTWDAEERVTSVADQGSTTRYTYDDEDRLAIERGPLGETSFVNRFYTVRDGAIAWKYFWAGTERIATKRQMPVGENEDMRYFFHKDLLGSTNLITDPNGQVFEHLEYFPSGETWVLEHSDIHRVSYLYTGGYLDEFRQIYNFGARWYEPRDQMFYSPDPSLATSPTAPIGDPALLAAYSYAENNPLRLVDRDGLAPEDAQNGAAGAAAFARPNGAHDTPKPRRIRALVQQDANDQPAADISRLDAKPAGQKNDTKTSKFKAFATFSADAVVEINLTKTSDGYKLKDVKVAPFLFKQYTVKKGEE